MGKYIIEIDDEILEEIKKSNTIKNHLNKADWSIRNATPYNPTGDAISREALIREIGRTDEWYKGRSICNIIDDAPPVEPRIEYGTDGQPYKLSMTNGKKYERTQGEWRDNLIEVFRQSAEIGGDTFHLFEIERIINGEPI